MMHQPILLSIQVGEPAEYGMGGDSDPEDRHWITGSFKEPVAGPIRLGRTNLDGDGQADLVNHGGLDKAVCAYPAEHYPIWRHELDRPGLPFGAFGENFTIAGLVEPDVCIGDVWQVGDAVVQVSQPRQPCWKLSRRWGIMDLPARVVEKGWTGWYFRVLAEGTVAPGWPMTLLARSCPSWTIERANLVMHHRKGDRALAARLASVPLLSASWQETLSRRVGEGARTDSLP